MRRFDLVGDIHQDDAPNQGKITNPIAKRKSCNKHPFQTALYFLSPPPSVQVSDMFFELLFFLVCRTEDHLRLWRRKNRLDNLKTKAPNLYRPWNQHGPWKLMVGKWNFLLGCPIFRCYAAMLVWGRFFFPQQMEPTRDSTWGVRHATFNIASWPSWLAITLQSYLFGCFWRETEQRHLTIQDLKDGNVQT